MADLIGQQLGQYQITGLLGEGGMAAVYRARQLNFNREVAVKVIKTGLQTGEFIQRFEREAQTLATLSHPHILKIFDYGRHEDTIYLVMELITGGSLAQLIERQRIPNDQVSRLLNQICDALDYAHQQSIVHRDLKPQNVLLDTGGNAILTDFGIAKLLSGKATTLTQAGTAIGTPAYMSPEQWTGESPLDVRSDVYALGVMLFEMLTGRLPFTGDTPAQLLYQHLQKTPPPIKMSRPDLPPSVEAVVNRAMAKMPANRYQSAGEMAKDFARVISDTASLPKSAAPKTADPEQETFAIAQATTPKTRILNTQPRRRPPIVPLLGVGLLLGIILIAVALMNDFRTARDMFDQTLTISAEIQMAAATKMGTSTAQAIAAAPSVSPTPSADLTSEVTPRPSGTAVALSAQPVDLSFGYAQQISVPEGGGLLLRLYFTPIGADGAPITTLPVRNARIVLDEAGGGAYQAEISEPTDPLHLVLVLDFSGSMIRNVPTMKAAVKQMIDSLPQETLFTLIGFDSEVVEYARAEADRSKLKSIVDQIPLPKLGAGACLFDAAIGGLQALSEFNASNFRQGVVVFTDGVDQASGSSNDSSGNPIPCSRGTLEDVLSLATRFRVPLYTIGFVRLPNQRLDDTALRQMASLTGGSFAIGADMPSLFEAIVNAIQSLKFAEAIVNPREGERAARLEIELENGQLLISRSLSFEVATDYSQQATPTPTPQPSFELTAPLYNPETFEISFSILNIAGSEQIRDFSISLSNLGRRIARFSAANPPPSTISLGLPEGESGTFTLLVEANGQDGSVLFTRNASIFIDPTPTPTDTATSTLAPVRVEIRSVTYTSLATKDELDIRLDLFGASQISQIRVQILDASRNMLSREIITDISDIIGNNVIRVNIADLSTGKYTITTIAFGADGQQLGPVSRRAFDHEQLPTRTPTPTLTLTHTPMPTATPSLTRTPTITPSPDPNRTIQFGQNGAGEGQFTDPRRIAVDDRGFVYVSDFETGRVQKFDEDGNYLQSYLLQGLNGLNIIQCLDTDSQGFLYVCISGGVVLKLNTDSGQVVRTINPGTVLSFDTLSFRADDSIVAMQSDDLYFFSSEFSQRSIRRSLIETLTDSPSTSAQLATDGAGNIFVLSTTQAVVFRLDPTGNFVDRFGQQGDEPGDFISPDAIAVGPDGRIYVSDFTDIKVFSAEGVFQESIRIPLGSVARDMKFTRTGRLFVILSQGGVLRLFPQQ